MWPSALFNLRNLATLMLLIRSLLLFVNISKSKLFSTGNHFKRRRELYGTIINNRTRFVSKVMPKKFEYDVVAEVITDGNAKLSKYKSRSSGMTVCIAEVNGPLVGGFLTFATEAFDDDGLPHTLEHLVFLGSEKYPYKGVLDLIASRCLAQGTNAWTDTDHTCYTVTTAGDEGFLKILPIYLDHLLFPTLTEAAFTTEVHHINGEGEDAGVVYCEMQGRENSGDSRCYLAMLRAVYPGHCGYKSETGGLMKNLRESTTNEKVHSYHKEFYRPENLCCIIVGQVKAEDVFKALIPVEERILQEGERNKFVRPWQSPVPPIPESVTIKVEYPTDEEEYGMVMVAWQGPSANDFSNVIAMQILLSYFTDTSVAPFNREFVEIEDPLCNDVDYSVIENSVTCVYLQFSSVPVSNLTEISEKLFALLKDFVDGKEQLDMQRLKTLITKKKLYILSSMEDSPHDHLSSCLIGDFLYGSTLDDLKQRVQEIPAIEQLLEKDAKFWTDLTKKYMLDGNHVLILGSPSIALSDKMSKDEKERIKKQQEMLGSDGLKEKAEILKKAVAANELPPPKEMLTATQVPSVKSIKFHPIKRTCNARESEGEEVSYSVNKMPCRFQVDDIHTNFVRLYVMIDTSHLSVEDRMYLPLLIELLDECAITRNGELVPYQEIVKQLAEDTISISASLGFGYSRFFSSSYAQTLMLNLMVEEDKYVKSVNWVNEILYKICIEPARIKSTINKMVTDVPSIKQSGGAVVKSMMKNLCFRPDSNHWTSSVFRQHAFLTELQKQLKSNPDQVVKKLNEIKESIATPNNMIVHLASNLDSLKKKVEPEKVWLEDFLPSNISRGFMSTNVKKCSEYILPISDEGPKNLIAGIGSVESSFLMQTADCKLKDIPDYASLLVLTNYFTQSEGPMWRQIRGCGYAYSYGISVNYDVGLIYFTLFKSTHLVKAYKEALNIIDAHLNGMTKWDKELLESARSSLMFELIDRVKTIGYVVHESVKSYCRDNEIDFTQELGDLLEKVSKVTTADMERVGMEYLKPLFNPQLSRCSVTCNPTKVNDITEEFKKLSKEFVVVPSLDESFMAKY